jgi:hypothetical protein
VSGHKPLPKSRHSRLGWQLHLHGGSCPKGQWLRVPEPFDPQIPMPNGEVYVLVRNYPGSQYEWCYVESKTLEASAT